MFTTIEKLLNLRILTYNWNVCFHCKLPLQFYCKTSVTQLKVLQTLFFGRVITIHEIRRIATYY